MKKMIFVLFFLNMAAFAEYRVYQYYVQPNSNYPTKAQSFIVTSMLDPISYKAYHGGGLTKTDLVRTWICLGYTGDGNPPCQGPSEQSLAGVDDENR